MTRIPKPPSILNKFCFTEVFHKPSLLRITVTSSFIDGVSEGQFGQVLEHGTYRLIFDVILI